ncbi:hypothetical protein PHLCEN_2v2733 [Hermanssonia centrifuga]|uniref:Uncharacterized protein n=1 Tax=Hermanssonia centrifuga TaxID=98765 RepID=A0A2R6RHT8_9APHY|nr:hypothetical protein PHLCEN_2v2733 [Hermanssonia centrifuga]
MSSAAAKGKAPANAANLPYELPWVEKYRPQLLNDIVGNNETIERLKVIAKDGNCIDVVRNKIKAFAQKKVTLPPGRHKIVILDEADR